MATQHLHRIVLVVPVAKVAAVVTWFQANVGPAAVDVNLGPGLAAVGDATNTVTYRWCDGSWSDAEAKAILSKLCQLAAVAVPTAAQWDNATLAQKRAWWLSVRDGVWTNYGAWCQLAPNDGAWDDPDACLALRGLKRLTGPG